MKSYVYEKVIINQDEKAMYFQIIYLAVWTSIYIACRRNSSMQPFMSVFLNIWIYKLNNAFGPLLLYSRQCKRHPGNPFLLGQESSSEKVQFPAISSQFPDSLV